MLVKRFIVIVFNTDSGTCLLADFCCHQSLVVLSLHVRHFSLNPLPFYGSSFPLCSFTIACNLQKTASSRLRVTRADRTGEGPEHAGMPHINTATNNSGIYLLLLAMELLYTMVSRHFMMAILGRNMYRTNF
jgi:hypothetical protein